MQRARIYGAKIKRNIGTQCVQILIRVFDRKAVALALDF